MNIEDYFIRHGKLKSFEKNEIIFSQGTKCPNIYFIQSGLIKAYYITEKGKESIKSFILPGEFIGSLRSMSMSEEATFSTLCLNDAKVISLNFSKLLEGSRSDLELSNQLSLGLLILAQKKELREYEFLTLSPKDRYKALVQRAPELINKVTQNDIARYLGITPVALSRIRGRIAKS